jgi:hypothetical protein
MEHEKPISGFFRDDETKIDPAQVAKPDLCLSCRRDGDPAEEILCILTRADQGGSPDFICHAFAGKAEK